MSSHVEEIKALMALGHDLNTATYLVTEDRARRFASPPQSAGKIVDSQPMILFAVQK